jgi:hypothetical protein
MPAIHGNVMNWIESCKRVINKKDPWDETSTRKWAENLDAALDDKNDALIAAWSVRLLGRIVSDCGSFEKHPFEHVPEAVEMVSAHEIHLYNWLIRVRMARAERAHAFIEALVLEWVIFRHLRVATRKLASQGVSTFKLRPEEGLLVLAAEDIPRPTFTSPRLRQIHRVLGDLHLLKLSENGTAISTEGKKLLESLS